MGRTTHYKGDDCEGGHYNDPVPSSPKAKAIEELERGDGLHHGPPSSPKECDHDWTVGFDWEFCEKCGSMKADVALIAALRERVAAREREIGEYREDLEERLKIDKILIDMEQSCFPTESTWYKRTEALLRGSGAEKEQ
jgi:hypothetical protein